MLKLETLDSFVNRMGEIVRGLEEFDVVGRLETFVDHVVAKEWSEATQVAIESAIELAPRVEEFSKAVTEVVGEVMIGTVSFEDIQEGLEVLTDVLADAVDRAQELEPEDWAEIAKIGGHLVTAAIMFATQNHAGGAIALGRALSAGATYLTAREQEPQYAAMAAEMPETFEQGLHPDFQRRDPLDLQDEYFSQYGG